MRLKRGQKPRSQKYPCAKGGNLDISELNVNRYCKGYSHQTTKPKLVSMDQNTNWRAISLALANS